MSYRQFFLDSQILSAEQEERINLELSADDLAHANVVRLRAGETIAVIDAANDYFLCEIIEATKHGLVVRIASREEHRALQRPRVRLFQGLSKGDRFEDVLRHATEIGVDEFVPLMSERTVVKLDAKRRENRMARWSAIVRSAAIQSGRREIPSVAEPVALADLRDMCQDDLALILFWEEASGDDTVRSVVGRALQVSTVDDARVSVIVGPEGGFSESEVQLLLTMGNASVLSLGSAILRTETAGLIAPALVLYELGCLGPLPQED